ncbi:bifunctional 5,10-methylenetetrahydrofolate dehydrogenase/5,10-methenyltetrahydrofolate cyclohydrolase [Limosilactobacillus reuteri]|uniref:bifunctional 5,10-methylenetetrahydrofolate dehydrogenase/5,10-methenyltetrahydrofolate cyclohydrolase n=1 Tax=Limosilactobacillus reuteri TaxID=1598 RepID=UPI001E3E1F2C|nr:tetrahydrofolate dehydrogenase/cyclohydrolase catalytic domain-containing protein [Limosilactobacillus reuteri]MCC4358468.1 bifunctional methylenetetrahydrofolate dehydrogenase/methenyltetrahydrofolate cyclohydrolase [Limosilactobacillus reuteri]MCC4363133.1 bifunctional methylenetetrahydrofolate dehydrogenase/methenyltetrahydrofolate cyclohydrolase [Limosilactobacillus reuteri]MCC4364973.1 bifunctional methylenetetrahydrofolate dehydrogenase/methenyltetrahydrofolate cyclohydrolase [Limosilac
MTTIIDGKALAKKINAQTKELVAQLKEKQNIIPGIAVVIAGDDAASLIYTRNKHNKAIKLGINSVLKKFPADVSQAELLAEIEKLNNDDTIDAILVQQPLPPQLDPEVITNAILPAKDVDGLNPLNLGKLFANQHGNYPVACTPRGIMRMLAEYNIDLQGKNAVIVGRSILVGKPLLALLNNANATVTMAGRSTSDLSALTKTADILIVATGVPNLIKATDVKSGAVVIDVGINRLSDGKLTGDVDFAAVKAKAQAITPVPGGVGPMTIATLMEQTVDLAQWRHHG